MEGFEVVDGADSGHYYNQNMKLRRAAEYLFYGLGAGLGLFILYLAFKQDDRPPPPRKRKSPKHKKSVSFSEISSPRIQSKPPSTHSHRRHFSYSPYIKASLFQKHQQRQA